MSRGFVKEGDQEEIPYVPPRAYLPPGATNYVTPQGLEALLEERKALIKEREGLAGQNENDRRVSANYINAKMQLLDDRINTARVIRLEDQPINDIRFGATVELLALPSGELQTLQLTGVDEAKSSKGKISFISPLARVLINKKVGDKVHFKRATDEVVYEIRSISYC